MRSSCTVATIAKIAIYNSESTTVIFAIYGCRPGKTPIIVSIVDFVESVVAKTLRIAMIVACVSMPCYLTITTARLVNTCPTVPYVKKTCFQVAAHPTRCPADTPFTGTAFGNSRPLIHDAPSAKRRPRRTNKWHPRGPRWQWVSRYSPFLQIWHAW